MPIIDVVIINIYRQMLADIEGLSTRNPGILNRIIVKESDYAQQGTCRLITGSLKPKILTLEETSNYLLKSTLKLATGSNNTLENALENAERVRAALELEEIIHLYLAMDGSFWPSPEVTITELVAKNILVEAALIIPQAVVNEARLVNHSIKSALDINHSYANMPRSCALNIYDSRPIAEVKTLSLVPLAKLENLHSLLEAKNGFKGRVSIVRPEYDILEQAVLVFQEVKNGVIYDVLPIDYKLNGGSHKLNNIVAELKAVLEREGLTLEEFIDKYYTSRPGVVTYFRNSDGTVDKIIEERSGQKYSTEEWKKQYDKLLDQERLSTYDLLKTQTKQLEALAEIEGMPPDIQDLATSLADIKRSLDSATPTTLYDILSELYTQVASLSTGISTAIQKAEQDASSGWKSNMDSLTKEVNGFQEKINDTKGKQEEIESGSFEPEEV